MWWSWACLGEPHLTCVAVGGKFSVHGAGGGYSMRCWPWGGDSSDWFSCSARASTVWWLYQLVLSGAQHGTCRMAFNEVIKQSKPALILPLKLKCQPLYQSDVVQLQKSCLPSLVRFCFSVFPGSLFEAAGDRAQRTFQSFRLINKIW